MGDRVFEFTSWEDNLPHDYKHRKNTEFFCELPYDIQDDLIAWFNTTPDEYEEEALTELYTEGKFNAWNCPKCGIRVYLGEPDDWEDYQGVMQADYTSYPGNSCIYTPEYLKSLCDGCRY